MTEYWIYLAVIGAFTLGYWVGHRKGKSDAQQEMMFQQQRMEATKVWTEAIGKMMGGGHHGGHN